MVDSGVPSSCAVPAASAPERGQLFAAQGGVREAAPRCAVARPQRRRQARHEGRDDHRRHHQAQPHAQQVQVEAVAQTAVVMRQRPVGEHDQAVAGHHQCGQASRVGHRQHCGGDCQRQQEQRRERIGITAVEVEERRQADDVERQLGGQHPGRGFIAPPGVPPGQRVHEGQRAQDQSVHRQRQLHAKPAGRQQYGRRLGGERDAAQVHQQQGT